MVKCTLLKIANIACLQTDLFIGCYNPYQSFLPLLLLEYIKQLLLFPKLNRLSEDLSNSLAAKYIFGSKIKVLGRWIEKDGENETDCNETNLQCQTFFFKVGFHYFRLLLRMYMTLNRL